MRLVSIASGSSGNVTYIGSEETHLLVDAGITNKRIEQGLNSLELSGRDLTGLLLTHEHADHVKGLNVLVRRSEVPVYATEGTLRALEKAGQLAGIPRELLHEIRAEEAFRIGDIEILPFSIDHDAAEPVAYRLECGEKKAAVATDLGHYTELIAEHLKGLDALLLESNHDVRMLEAGPYPYPLKRRILGNFGHLSNENAGRLLAEVLHDGVKEIFLGHLSKENNLPELAYETVRQEITAAACPYRGDDFRIRVAKRDTVSEVCVF